MHNIDTDNGWRGSERNGGGERKNEKRESESE